MKYLWMVMLGLVYGNWTVAAIKDIVKCWRDYKQNGSAAFDRITCVWVVVTIVALFLWSLVLWVMG